MRRRIVFVIIGVPLASIVMGAGAALSVPTVRHMISGLWNLPDRLPALPDNSQVHYQPGAEDFARDVTVLLPDAIARVEAVHGRRFAYPVTVGAYATPEAYAAANGIGSDIPVGVTFAGRVNLSPKLFWPQHQRLRAILTHELSHAHIAGWIRRPIHPPAELVQGRLGGHGVGGRRRRTGQRRGSASRNSTRRANRHRRGRKPAKPGRCSARKNACTGKPPWYPVVLAYRQAGMFVNYLRESDRPAFDRMMNAILDGHTFAEAVDVGYHDDVRSLWQQFIKSGADLR